MKISTNNILKNYTDLPIHTTEYFADKISSNKNQKFDVITIQSNRRQIEERTFAEAVSKELHSAVNATASEEKLQNLQNQIQLGNYQIDTHALASKILLV